MGWTFCNNWNTKEKAVADALEGRDILAQKIVKEGRDSVAWSVIRHKGKEYILCILLECHAGAWGYKDLDESMHPYYYSCPHEFLDMAPMACADWRAKVLAA